ncbi:NAD(+) diphosphatase [Sphingomonas crocodyli]|uniref:NAD(+) diphosphatase n=1 Tax=Sphingomonas crocodyli TaxID=1979270 RepID=A0A437M9K7_9SPHN|nr:NAD(+) diphosphatase [Sphingomonas crocodyli]RVT94391.1 NAD(+) diphosphatase [Sphingomonas crocodyli]
MARFAPPGFTGSPLVRIDNERDNQAYHDEQLARADAKLLRLTGLAPDVLDGGLLGWGPASEAAPDATLALLGLIDGAPHFVPIDPVQENGAQRSAAMSAALGQLKGDEAATYAVARCLIDWHSRHQFCPRCGKHTRPMRSGWARLCDKAAEGCGSEHFPRTDPVVIMLAEYEGKILVGRQKPWPQRNYSALAGFVEVGESIEEAVARELFEEAGVKATKVRYIASQPWPFPSQLMIACIAEVESADLNLDTREIEAAIWVDKDGVEAALRRDESGPFMPPPPFAIANTLLNAWVAGA